MTGEALCQCASVTYKHLTSVGLSAGQYVGLGKGGYVHFTMRNVNLDHAISQKVESQLGAEYPPSNEALAQAPKDHMDFWRRILAGKQLGGTSMDQAQRDLELRRRTQATVTPPDITHWTHCLDPPTDPKEKEGMQTDLEDHEGTPPKKQQRLTMTPGKEHRDEGSKRKVKPPE